MSFVDLIKKLLETEQAYQNTLEESQTKAPELFQSIRERYGWSQRALADLLEVDHTYISKIENGHLKPGKPILSNLAKLIERQEDDD